MGKYKACVVDDDQNVRELLVECLRFSDFEVHAYAEAEHLIDEVFTPGISHLDMPDLVVVDLQLKPDKIQGLDLVSELAEMDVPSEVMVLLGDRLSSDMSEDIKIWTAAVITKPFDNIFDLARKMERQAQIGMKRRLRRQQKHHLPADIEDVSRLQRPVFLSYCNEDRMLANGIKRNLETRDIDAWYAPTTLETGDAWRIRIIDGIDQAKVFVAIVTEAYLNSPYCIAELNRFHRRIDSGKDPQLLLLPVLNSSSESVKRHHLVRPIFDNFHYLDLSVRFIDGLTALFGRIQQMVGHPLKENEQK
jgi:FixJ family two-component response regulator